MATYLARAARESSKHGVRLLMFLLVFSAHTASTPHLLLCPSTYPAAPLQTGLLHGPFKSVTQLFSLSSIEPGILTDQ